MQLSENMDQAKDSDADCLPGMGEEEVGEEDERQAEDEDDGEEREGAEGHEDIRDMAMVALGLLKQEVKVMLQQVKQLVKTNPQLASQVFTTDIEGWTPVHAVALRGKRKVLKAMLHAGIDVNARMGQPDGLPAGCTLLHMAANRQDKKVADYLMHHGADVNATDSFGRTPLFYAQRKGNRDVIKLLLDGGAREGPAAVGGVGEEEEGGGWAPGGRVGPGLPNVDELTTPEPKLTRFCFLPLPQQPHHHQRHRHRQQHHHRHHQNHHQHQHH